MAIFLLCMLRPLCVCVRACENNREPRVLSRVVRTHTHAHVYVAYVHRTIKTTPCALPINVTFYGRQQNDGKGCDDDARRARVRLCVCCWCVMCACVFLNIVWIFIRLKMQGCSFHMAQNHSAMIHVELSIIKPSKFQPPWICFTWICDRRMWDMCALCAYIMGFTAMSTLAYILP